MSGQGLVTIQAVFAEMQGIPRSAAVVTLIPVDFQLEVIAHGVHGLKSLMQESWSRPIVTQDLFSVLLDVTVAETDFYTPSFCHVESVACFIC
jgi:hypothetical protein